MSDKLNIGDVIKVKVKGIVNYGVFVECPENYKGLIHISNIINGFTKDPNDFFKVDDEVEAEIIAIDNDNRKLGLSTKKFNLNSAK